jgi:hypothetical protein
VPLYLGTNARKRADVDPRLYLFFCLRRAVPQPKQSGQMAGRVGRSGRPKGSLNTKNAEVKALATLLWERRAAVCTHSACGLMTGASASLSRRRQRRTRVVVTHLQPGPEMIGRQVGLKTPTIGDRSPAQ